MRCVPFPGGRTIYPGVMVLVAMGCGGGEDDDYGDFTETVETQPPGGTGTPSGETTPTPAPTPEPTEVPGTEAPTDPPEPEVFSFEALERDGTLLGQAAYRLEPQDGGGVLLQGWTNLNYSEVMPFTSLTRTTANIDDNGRLLSATVQQEVLLGTTPLHRGFEFDAAASTIRVYRGGANATWQFSLENNVPLALWSWEADPVLKMGVPDIGLAYIALRAKTSGRASPVVAIPDFYSLDGDITGNGPCYTVTERFCQAGDGFIDTLTLADVGLTLERTRQQLSPDQVPELPDPGTTRSFDLCPLPEGTEVVETRLNTADGLTLAVEYLYPGGEERRRAAVFMGDTGGADRDWTMGGVAVGRCIAAEMLAQGIAVVRFDDRGHGESSGVVGGLTFDDRTDDLLLVLANATAQPFIDSGELVVVGLGEGAHHGALAMKAGKAYGLVGVGSFATTGGDAWLQRSESFLTEAGFPADYISAYMSERTELVTAVLEGESLESSIDGLPIEYWEEYFAFDPALVWPSLTGPVLLIHGDDDWEVPPTAADQLSALVTSASQTPEVAHIPNVTHHMVPPLSGNNVGGEYYLPAVWNKEAQDTLVDWVKAIPPR